MTEILKISEREVVKSSNWNSDDPILDDYDVVTFQAGTGSISFSSSKSLTGRTTPYYLYQRNFYETPNLETEKESGVIELEGDVEKIKEDFAIVVFKIDSDFEERIIPVKRLKAENAAFEGARIKLIIEDHDSEVTSRIINITDHKKPLWLSPDEDMIRILSEKTNGK